MPPEVAEAIETPVVETPAADAAKPVETKTDESAAADLLAAEAKQDGEPDAAKAASDAGQADAGKAQPEAAKEVVAYNPVELPDGLEVVNPERFNERVSVFDAKLSDLEKKFNVDHDTATAFRSEVMSMALTELAQIKSQSEAAIKAANEQAATAYQRHLETQKQEWKAAFEDAKDLAGNRRDTTLNRAESAIRQYAGDEKALRQALQETGMANNPAMIRLLSNIGAALEEGSMVPAKTPASSPKTKAVKMYGT